MVFDIKPIVSPKPTDCGATCLKMLLAYYKKDVDLDTLIKKLDTRLIGCTGADILRAGGEYGLDMRAWGELKPGQEVAPDALVINVGTLEEDRPAIIHWRYNHWCVLCGKDEDGKVVVINPDRGRMRFKESVFRQFYTDISITNGIPQKESEVTAE